MLGLSLSSVEFQSGLAWNCITVLTELTERNDVSHTGVMSNERADTLEMVLPQTMWDHNQRYTMIERETHTPKIK